MFKFISSILFILFSLNVLAKTIQISVPNYYPYATYDKKEDKVRGLWIEIVTEAFKAQNLRVDFNYLPGKRLFSEFIVGSNPIWSGSPNVFKANPDFFKSLKFVPVFHAVNKLHVCKGHGKQLKMNDVKGENVAIVSGNEDDNKLMRKYFSTIVDTKSTEQMFEMFTRKRLDAVVTLDITAKIHLKNTVCEGKDFVLLEEGNIGMVFHPKFKNLYYSFETGLSKIVENGKYFKIVERYFKRHKLSYDDYKNILKYKKNTRNQ